MKYCRIVWENMLGNIHGNIYQHNERGWVYLLGVLFVQNGSKIGLKVHPSIVKVADFICKYVSLTTFTR